MKPFLILSICLLGAILMQGCKKDSTDDDATTTTATPVLQAYIGGTVWTPDTLSAGISYNAASNSKTFNCTGTISQKRIVFSVKQANAVNDNTFPAGTYNVDGTGMVNMAYYTQQLVSAGVYNFVLYGTVQPGSGTVTISSIDAANKTITGTYSFTSTKINYDDQGNDVSINVAGITSGVFNAMPYTFSSN